MYVLNINKLVFMIRMKKSILLMACMWAMIAKTQTLTPDITAKDNAKMQWWKDAKYGMFIHWGLYAIPAGKWGSSTSHGEWLMKFAKIPRQEYALLAKQFNPIQFDADAWVKLAKDAGQKYMVLTAKHHDGFALFRSKASTYNVVDATPFKKDIVEAYANACRKYGMKMGLYYSQAQDWYHPGGAVWAGQEWDSTHLGKMDAYIDSIALPQVKEILGNYGDVAVLWWDTPVGMTKEMSQKLADVVKQYPNLITNNRLGAGMGGDLETPEQFIPATGFPDRNWEVCMTMNGNWGYNAYDDKWKSTKDILQKLIDIVSKGGNFLLNVGPNPYGIIPEVCQTNLLDIGQWLQQNGQAIYGTTASPFPYLSWGRATRKEQKLYLHVFQWPANQQLVVPMNNKITHAHLLADPKTALKVHFNNGVSTIQLPAYSPDKRASVIEVDFKGEPIITPAPSVGKKVFASVADSASNATYLTDNNPHTRWQAPKGDTSATLTIDLGKPETIQAIGLIETAAADGVLSHKKQHHELLYWTGSEWKSVVQVVTNGAGQLKDFTPIKAQKFQLIVRNAKQPSLAEWVLYKTE